MRERGINKNKNKNKNKNSKSKFLTQYRGYGSISLTLSMCLISTTPSTAQQISEKELERVMGEYCIPKERSNCSPNVIANYTGTTIHINEYTTTHCLCENPSHIWIANKRTCEAPQCAAGQYVEIQGSCGAGNYIDFT